MHPSAYHLPVSRYGSAIKYAFHTSVLSVTFLSSVPAGESGILLPWRRNHAGTVADIFSLRAAAVAMIIMLFFTATAASAASLFLTATAATSLFFTFAAFCLSAHVSPAGIISPGIHTAAAFSPGHLSLRFMAATAPLRPAAAAAAGITAAAVSPSAATQKH